MAPFFELHRKLEIEATITDSVEELPSV